MKRKQAALFSILLCVAILFSSVPGTGLLSAATGTPVTPDYLSSNPETPQITTYTQESILERDYEEITELNVPDVVGYGTAVEKGHIARVRSEEKDLYSVVFSNGDGTNTLYMFSDPVKFVDKDGKVRDKSNKIIADEGGFTNGDNDIRVSFPSLLNDGVKLAYNDIDIIMKPKVKALSTARLEALDDKTASEEFVRYDNVFGENTYLTYKPEYMGFKEDIILTEYTGQSEFEFTLLTGGLELYKDTSDSEGGSLYLRNSKGEMVASLGQVIIFTADNGNNSFGTYEFETVKENEEYTVTIKVDPDYLKDPKTVYPVTIDPTITINYNNGSGAILDITLNSTTGSDGSSTVVTVGKSSTYGIRRILMRFPALNLNGIYPEQITSANVYVRDLMCQTTGLEVYCHAFQGTLNWSESSATWSNVSPNSYNSSYLSYKTIKYDGTVSYSFSVLSAIKNWASKINGAGYNGLDDIGRGIIFKLSTSIENSSLIDAKTLGSFNNATTSYKPYLMFTYNSLTPTVTINTKPSTLPMGQTYQLTATTNPSGLAIQWISMNQDIATVSSTGVVTPLKAGTAYIIARLQSDSSISDNFTLTVLMQNGVYYIKNNYYSDKYLTASSGGTSMSNLKLETKKSGSQLDWQKWKVIHVGNGNYIIRPLHVLTLDGKNAALGVYEGTISDSTVGFIAAISFDTFSNNDYRCQWKIAYNYNGYRLLSKIKVNNKEMYASADATGTNVVRAEHDWSANFGWDFEYIQAYIPVTSINTTLDMDFYKNDAYPGRQDIFLSSSLISVYPSSATDKRVKWTTSDSNIATIDQQNNMIYFYSRGIVDLIATSLDTGVQTSYTVTNMLPDGNYTLQNRWSGKHAYYLNYLSNYSNQNSINLTITAITSGANRGRYNIKFKNNNDLLGISAWNIYGGSNGYYQLYPASSTTSALTANSNDVMELLQYQYLTAQDWKLINIDYQDFAVLGFDFTAVTVGDIIDTTNDIISINSDLLNRGYRFGSMYTYMSVEKCLQIMDETRVFVAYTHGNSSSIALVENNNGLLQRRILSVNDISEKFQFKNDYFANIDLAVLISCYTGDESAGSETFANRLYNNGRSDNHQTYTGATTVVAFNNPIDYEESREWKSKFFYYLYSEFTIEDALKKVNWDKTGEWNNNYIGYVTCGGISRTINP